MYASRPDDVARMVDRSRRYLYDIVVEVEQRGMPLEVALLPMVESAFNPNAMSVGRASGIWQFMPSTGYAQLSQAELLVRLPARCRGGDRRRPYVPVEAPHRLQRLAARAGRVQLGRRQRGPLPSRRTRSLGQPVRLSEASRCRRKPATSCPTAGLKTLSVTRRSTASSSATSPTCPISPWSRSRADRRESSRPRSPRCPSTNSSISIRSTIGR